jgi:muramoyltetrapeptide carboxypeptidase
VSIKPPRLAPGDFIGVLAPAGPVAEEEIQPGIEAFESLGFHVLPSPNLLRREGYLAGSDDLRLHDFHTMFGDDRVKAIICARGGYGSLRLFDRIDFDLIKRHPKILVGYSDITSLLLAVYRRANLVTLHGPVLKDITRNRGRNLELLVRLLTSDELITLRFNAAKPIREGSASGRLIGGNLSLLTHLLGTPFMPSLKGALLFIEERGEAPYRIDRMLTQLRLSGLLDKCAGLMIGTFEECGEVSDVTSLIEERLSDLPVPIMIGLPVGHGEENLAMPIGVKAVLDTSRMTLRLKERCTAAPAI